MVQLVGGGQGGYTSNHLPQVAKCGEYKKIFIPVTPGQVLSGNIGAKSEKNGGTVTLGGYTANVGGGSPQTGAFLKKGTGGNAISNGFEGGNGGNGYNMTTLISGAIGSNELGNSSGTGGAASGGSTTAGTNGGGGGASCSSNGPITPAGSGYGGAGGSSWQDGGNGGGGTGAIAIHLFY